jgi:RimJ/RimL family protein N-acetyltransferase
MDSPATELRTDRLVLHPFREEDREPFAAMNADPEVMAHFPWRLTREQSDELVDRLGAHRAAHGFAPWAIEAPGVAPFVGMAGLLTAGEHLPFAPAVEVLWRLARAHWGRGYATEAARAAVAHGFETVGLDEIVSFTVPANRRSIAVMVAIGMEPAGTFEHPKLPKGHPLRHHVLYRLRRDDWGRRAGAR